MVQTMAKKKNDTQLAKAQRAGSARGSALKAIAGTNDPAGALARFRSAGIRRELTQTVAAAPGGWLYRKLGPVGRLIMMLLGLGGTAVAATASDKRPAVRGAANALSGMMKGMAGVAGADAGDAMSEGLMGLLGVGGRGGEGDELPSPVGGDFDDDGMNLGGDL